MKFSKCVRCGCFFESNDTVCPNCKLKDEIDKKTIRNFILNNDLPKNAASLAYQSGVSIKNLNRYLNSKDFSSLKDAFEININL